MATTEPLVVAQRKLSIDVVEISLSLCKFESCFDQV